LLGQTVEGEKGRGVRRDKGLLLGRRLVLGKKNGTDPQGKGGENRTTFRVAPKKKNFFATADGEKKKKGHIKKKKNTVNFKCP